MQKTIAIIGGGAAGMMTAATLVEREDFSGHVLLFEKNSKLGAKVIISGGGRCNVTTGVYKRKELKTYYTRGAEFLDTAFRSFGPRQVVKRFEAQGVPLKQEEDGRIFPVSDDGKDIVGVFEQLFAAKNIDIQYKEGVETIEKNGDRYSVITDNARYTVDAVVLATGGNAYAHTGSSGDGYAFARSLGHTITPLGPSLNSFMTKEKRLTSLSGLSFKHAKIYINQSTTTLIQGPILLTHFGLSGPAVFVLASHTAFEEVSHDSPLDIRLQPLASMGYDAWMHYLKQANTEHPKKEIHSILSMKLAKRFALSLLAELEMQSSMKVGVMTKIQREAIADYVGNGISLQCMKRRPGDEFVTAGGVSRDEIDAATMESKLSPGLYFAGEIVDVDGVTGGFNLQASRAMGRLVGKHI